MTADELIVLVERWAAERQIIAHSTPQAQALKLMSEVGELADAIAKDDELGVIDAIGDCTVVLTILAKQIGLSLHVCYGAAWHQIKDRRGRMSAGGVFVREETT